MRLLLLFSLCLSVDALVRPPTRRATTPSRNVRVRGLASRGGSVLTPVVKEMVKTARSAITAAPLASVAASFVLGAFIGLLGASPLGDVFDRYHTVEGIPNHRFTDHDAIAGVVVKVADGDTMRARHVPALDFARGRWRPKSRAEGGKLKLSEETLQLRLYAVDAPETKKFGNAGMPLGDVATAFVKDRVDSKRVRITLQSRDQYQRAVVKIQYGFWRKDLSEELLKAGLATVYRSAGSQYGKGKTVETWNAIENNARARGVGLWAGGGTAMDPAAYKRAIRAAGAN